MASLLFYDDLHQSASSQLPGGTVARMETVGHPLHTQEKESVLLAMTALLKLNGYPKRTEYDSNCFVEFGGNCF